MEGFDFESAADFLTEYAARLGRSGGFLRHREGAQGLEAQRIIEGMALRVRSAQYGPYDEGFRTTDIMRLES